MMPSSIQTDTVGRRNDASPLTGGDFNPDDRYFASLRTPFGPAALALRIGPIDIRLQGLSAGQADLLRDRYRPFLHRARAAGAAAPALVISLRTVEVNQFLALPKGGGEIYRMERRVSEKGFSVWSYEFAGSLDVRERTATLGLVQSEGHLFDRGLENFLRVLTAAYVLERGGLLIHAAAIVRNGRAFVFFGPSGSGKTTVTHLSPRDVILSDDLALILPGPEGYRAAGIPFGMAHHRIPQTNASFPVASLNRLVQSTEVDVEPIAGGRALAELAGSLPFVMQEPAQASRALETARRVLGSVPVRRLYFRRDESFWTVIEGV